MSDIPLTSTQKRKCGICGGPLSVYNKGDICQSHSLAAASAFRDQQTQQVKRSRDIASFVSHFHGSHTVEEMFVEARKQRPSSKQRQTVENLERYQEALGMLKVMARVLRLSMPGVLRLKVHTNKYNTARAVLAFLLGTDLGMDVEDIAIFMGYAYVPAVQSLIEKTSIAFLEDEDLILAVDLVRWEMRYLEEQAEE